MCNGRQLVEGAPRGRRLAGSAHHILEKMVTQVSVKELEEPRAIASRGIGASVNGSPQKSTKPQPLENARGLEHVDLLCQHGVDQMEPPPDFLETNDLSSRVSHCEKK